MAVWDLTWRVLLTQDFRKTTKELMDMDSPKMNFWLFFLSENSLEQGSGIVPSLVPPGFLFGPAPVQFCSVCPMQILSCPVLPCVAASLYWGLCYLMAGASQSLYLQLLQMKSNSFSTVRERALPQCSLQKDLLPVIYRFGIFFFSLFAWFSDCL